MNEAESRELLVDVVAVALEGGMSLLEIGRLIPPERRGDVLKALKRLGYRSAATTLESLTGEQRLGRLWE
jgi:hypothetical protein